MKRNNIVLIFVIFILTISLVNTVLAQEQIQVGVSEGDVFNYKLDCSFQSTDPNEKYDAVLSDTFNQDSLQIKIVQVEGPLIQTTVTYHYKNGATKTVNGSINFETKVALSVSGFIIPANLKQGDQIYTFGSLPSPTATINETITKEYAGENREVNLVHVLMDDKVNNTFTQTTREYQFYFDKKTGIIFEHRYETNEYSPTNSTYKSTTIVAFKISSITNIEDSYTPTFFDVNVEDSNYQIAAISNSSISNLSFNPSLKEITFNTNGESGTIGSLSISIPKELMWGDFSIYKDNTLLSKNVDYTQTENETCCTFQITYAQSEHAFSIKATQAIPEFPSIIILALVIIATIAGALLYKRRQTKT